MVRDGAGDQLPEARPVAHVPQVAQLVRDHVVPQLGGDVEQFVAEVQVPLAGAAAPPRRRVFDAHALVAESVNAVELREALGDECTGLLAVCQIVRAATGEFDLVLPDTHQARQLPHDPLGVRLDEALDGLQRRIARRGDDHGAALMHGHAQTPCTFTDPESVGERFSAQLWK